MGDLVKRLRAWKDNWGCDTIPLAKDAADEIERLRAELDALRGREPNEDLAHVVSKAMRRAWQLGQTYWQQADSEYHSQNKKADETEAKFQKLVDETRGAVLAPQPAAPKPEGPE